MLLKYSLIIHSLQYSSLFHLTTVHKFQPIFFCATLSRPPPTPLFVGIPVFNANSPDPSYIPQVSMIVCTILTVCDEIRRFP